MADTTPTVFLARLQELDAQAADTSVSAEARFDASDAAARLRRMAGMPVGAYMRELMADISDSLARKHRSDPHGG